MLCRNRATRRYWEPFLGKSFSCLRVNEVFVNAQTVSFTLALACYLHTSDISHASSCSKRNPSVIRSRGSQRC